MGMEVAMLLILVSVLVLSAMAVTFWPILAKALGLLVMEVAMPMMLVYVSSQLVTVAMPPVHVITLHSKLQMRVTMVERLAMVQNL